MSQQKMQCGGVHSLRTRVTAGLVAGVTAFAGLGISAQAAPAREAKAPVGASQTAAPHIKTVTGYMSSTDQWHTKIFTKKDLVLSLIHISEPTRRLSRSRMPSSA